MPNRSLRTNAYVLAADPAYLAASIQAYYPYVDSIVVSYDRSGRSWTGTPLPIDECLTTIKELDVAGKCVFAPGDYWRPGIDPLDNDTHQRRQALTAASRDADWVLQLDTDEIMVAPEAFFACLSRADDAGASALDYPSRWLYARTGDVRSGGGRYLEGSTRLWRPAASYPGPLAVRSGTQLELARQAPAAPRYRVDLRPWNTDPAQGRTSVVHEVIPVEHAVVHYSWVRDADQMRRKFGWSGHTEAYSPPSVFRRWEHRRTHPWLTALTSPLRRWDTYRLVTIEDEATP